MLPDLLFIQLGLVTGSQANLSLKVSSPSMQTIPCTLLGLTVKPVGCHTALNGDGAPIHGELYFSCCLGPDHQPEPCNPPCSAAGPGNHRAGLCKDLQFFWEAEKPPHCPRFPGRETVHEEAKSVVETKLKAGV